MTEAKVTEASAIAAVDQQTSSGDRFSFTLFLALAIHALILFGIGIGVPQERPPQRSLEITLAQYQSEQAPERADFLAQTNQIGSGDLEEKKQLSTNQVADFSDNVIREVQPIEQSSPSQPEPRHSPKVVTTNNRSLQVSSNPALRQLAKTEKLSDNLSLKERNLEIASLEAQLRRQKQILAKGPRKRQLTAASAMASRDALYLDNWRKRIEVVGNRNYPQELGVYGDLRLLVAIKADGSVHRVKILKSSGHKALDDAALRIVQLAAPYQAFPKEIRRDTDMLEIIRTWRFQPGNYLSSE